MSAVRDAANVSRGLASIRVRDAANVLRSIGVARIRDASNVLRTIFNAMSATASPETVTRTQASSGGTPLTLTTGIVTASVSGGTAPYSYAWTYLAGDVDVTATTPTGNPTAFSASLDPGELKGATFLVTVTDANGATATSSVNATFHHVSLL